jgi:hypothetical protein
MAKRNPVTTGSEDNKTPERRRRTSESPGKTPAPKSRGRQQSDVPAEVPAPATASDVSLAVGPQAPAPVIAAAAVDAPVSSTVVPGGDVTAAVQVSHEQIALRAYHLYLERGGQPGDQFIDWVTAERQLREQLAFSG